MRTLLLLLIATVTLAGPAYYLTVGARARSERREALLRLEAQKAEVIGLLSNGAPPSEESLDRARSSLEDRQGTIDDFARRALAFARSKVLSTEELRELGLRASIDPRITDPLLGGIGADDSIAIARRRALGAVLRAALDRGVEFESLHVASSLSTPDPALPVEFVRVTTALLGHPRALVDFAELLLHGSAADPPGDLVLLELRPTDEQEWDRLGRSDDAPPLRLQLTVDLVAPEGPR